MCRNDLSSVYSAFHLHLCKRYGQRICIVFFSQLLASKNSVAALDDEWTTDSGACGKDSLKKRVANDVVKYLTPFFKKKKIASKVQEGERKGRKLGREGEKQKKSMQESGGVLGTTHTASDHHALQTCTEYISLKL